MRMLLFDGAAMGPRGERFARRHVFVIKPLAVVLAADLRSGAISGGWRSRRWLIKEIEKITGWDLDPQALSAYVSQINRIIPLIESQKNVGYRLREPVEFDEL